MKQYIDYFSEESISQILIRERLKNARKRGQIQKINGIANNKKAVIMKNDNHDLLKDLIPPRRMWIRPSTRRRCRYSDNCKEKKCQLQCKNRQNLNSYDLAILSLNLTLKKLYRNENCQYLTALRELRSNLLEKVKNLNFTFENPDIIAIPKDLDKGIYRPIAKYCLEDKLIICLTNRYFIDLFDSFFKDVSFAFRSSKSKKNHHKAFIKIIKYNEKQKQNNNLWVSECDIQKFYDTVNHSIIKKEFEKLISRVKKTKNDDIDFSMEAQSVFYKYLDSYAFNKNIIKLNKDKEYWSEVRGSSDKKEFGWIEPNVLKKQYKRIGKARIGVPQGGALSGLIANIVLNTIDERIINDPDYDKDFLYVRFCDDIVMIHSDKDKCQYFSDIYYNSLQQLKLFPHPPTDLSSGYSKKFWESKTKLNYCWSKKNCFPWVGFVGYEINRAGNVRVRKGSIQKEINKQRDWISSIIQSLKDSESYNKNSVQSTATGHLVGMSVGLSEVHNYMETEIDMCWVNGFSCINDNHFIRIQLRRLDKERNRQITRLKRFLSDQTESIEDDEDENEKHRNYNRQIREHLGKPFSYFYNGLKGK